MAYGGVQMAGQGSNNQAQHTQCPVTKSLRAARRLASDDPPTPQHENAAEVLGAIARARACPLTRGLVHPNAITLLARHAFAHGPRSRRVQVPRRPIGLC